MRRIVRSLLVTFLAGAVVLQSAESGAEEVTLGRLSSGDEQAELALIKKMEEERVQAGVRKDVGAISAATAEDYLQIDLDGNVRDKSAALRRIESAEIQLQSNSLDQMVVRLFGDTAVVTARSTPKGTINGKDFPPIRYSRVYVKRGGRWQVVMFQMTRIAEDTER